MVASSITSKSTFAAVAAVVFTLGLSLPGAAYTTHGATLHDRVVDAQRRHHNYVERRQARSNYRQSYRNAYRNDYRSARRVDRRYRTPGVQVYGRNFGYLGYRNNGSRYAPSCRRVTKQGYWRGHPARVGGLQCTDSRGYSYIKPNSRYLIRYY